LEGGAWKRQTPAGPIFNSKNVVILNEAKDPDATRSFVSLRMTVFFLDEK
jgi:hypothetical protein